jgi:hypothetical protein
MRPQIYEGLTKEIIEERQRVELLLHNLNAEIKSQVNDLDAALHILSQIADLFPNRTPQQQRAILLQMVERVVINGEGRILRLELKPPFSYLTTLATGGSNNAREKTRRTKTSGKADCSLHITALTPDRNRTCDPPLRRRLLYPLSYEGECS